MKKMIFVLLVLISVSSTAFASTNLDSQNWEMDMVTVGDGDC